VVYRAAPKPRAQPDRQAIQSTENISALLGVSVGSEGWRHVVAVGAVRFYSPLA
jgi:hypothetical protein